MQRRLRWPKVEMLAGPSKRPVQAPGNRVSAVAVNVHFTTTSSDISCSPSRPCPSTPPASIVLCL